MADRPPTRGMKSRESTAALHDFLAGAPEPVSTAVLQKAGLHMRLVSHAFNSLHPPLLALTPNLNTTPEDIPAHLAALPSTLTSLDLRGLRPLSDDSDDEEPDELITPAALAAIAAKLPLLQELTLPSVPPSLRAALLVTLQACPALHTLHVEGWLVSNSHPPFFPPLLDPPIAARLRSLSKTCSEGTLCAAPPGSLPNLSSIYLFADWLCGLPGGPPLPRQLAVFCAAAPALHTLTLNLSPNTGQQAGAVHVLTALTALMDLTLEFTSCDQNLQDAPTSSLLQHVGALTTLRSLTLEAAHNGWTPPEAGWLQRLTQLTSLNISFCFECDYDWDEDEDDDEDEDEDGITLERSQAAAATFTNVVAPAIAEVATSAARLPLLHRLALGFDTSDDDLFCCEPWLQCGTPDSFFRHLAAATQLRHLCLCSLPLPHQDASLLTRLQHLTALQLRECTVPGQHKSGRGEGPGARTLAWVAALPYLRQLSWKDSRGPDSMEGHPFSPTVRSSLANLHTLAVQFKRGTVLGCPLEQLLDAVSGRLERLELSDEEWECSKAGVQVLHQLQQLTCLRVLDLQYVVCMGSDGDSSQEPALLQHLRLPPSLRHCYLSRELQPGSAAVQRLQAAYPLVAFRLHARLDTDVW